MNLTKIIKDLLFFFDSKDKHFSLTDVSINMDILRVCIEALTLDLSSKAYNFIR
jgi:hypothetical protein